MRYEGIAGRCPAILCRGSAVMDPMLDKRLSYCGARVSRFAKASDFGRTVSR